MEMAQFGDTEVDSSDVKATWKSLSAEDGSNSKLNTEFSKLANIVDDRKALSVGKLHIL